MRKWEDTIHIHDFEIRREWFERNSSSYFPCIERKVLLICRKCGKAKVETVEIICDGNWRSIMYSKIKKPSVDRWDKNPSF